jgi:hypothetical protein
MGVVVVPIVIVAAVTVVVVLKPLVWAGAVVNMSVGVLAAIDA